MEGPIDIHIESVGSVRLVYVAGVWRVAAVTIIDALHWGKVGLRLLGCQIVQVPLWSIDRALAGNGDVDGVFLYCQEVYFSYTGCLIWHTLHDAYTQHRHNGDKLPLLNSL